MNTFVIRENKLGEIKIWKSCKKSSKLFKEFPSYQSAFNFVIQLRSDNNNTVIGIGCRGFLIF